MLRRATFVVLMTCLFLTSSQARMVRAVASSSLEGVWQVIDVGGTAAAGLYVFTPGNHYSIMFATKDRPQIDDTKASADELRAMWGPMAANAGTYEVAGNLVTIKPIVAKIPIVMAPGANEVYAFSVDGKTLSLTQQRNEASRFKTRTQCISPVWNNSLVGAL